ncbi:HAD family hydrolase [Reinekea sp.]|jgi:phosphoglycolate phosphatase|uniref:HAD family hydrolase n=1 Tax=Reinekea sp. TaxID=1970455 RepID=UPI002A81089E|nr:HAD family hydrolase [Reinekea sp.]
MTLIAMTVKAIAFDMDGTLLDTLDDIADSMNSVLARQGLPRQPTANYRQFVGSGARRLVERALPATHTEAAQVEHALAEFEVQYANNWSRQTRLYPGIGTLLDSACERGLALAILTNKPQIFADQCVDHFLPRWPWQVVQGQVEGLAVKPSTDVSNRVTAALALPPEHILYLGDSDVDMYTARNAGYCAVGVTWGFRSEAELRAAGAQVIVHRPDQVLALLG